MILSLILFVFLLHLLKMMSSWFHMNLHSPCNLYMSHNSLLYMLSSNYQHMRYIRCRMSSRFLNSYSYRFLHSQYMMCNHYILLNMLHYRMYSYLHMMNNLSMYGSRYLHIHCYNHYIRLNNCLNIHYIRYSCLSNLLHSRCSLHSHYMMYIQYNYLYKCLSRLFYSFQYRLMNNCLSSLYNHLCMFRYMRCNLYMIHILIYMYPYSDLCSQYHRCLRRLLNMLHYMMYSPHMFLYMNSINLDMNLSMYLDKCLHKYLNRMFDKNLNMSLNNLNMFLYMRNNHLCKYLSRSQCRN